MGQSNFCNAAGVVLSAVLLGGCAGSDVAELNKKVSDVSYGLLSLGKKTDSNEGGGLPTLSKNSPVVDKKNAREFDVPVDVDTVAARVKRYYNFTSSDEVNRLNNSSNSNRWVAASITDGAYAWDAQPGAYYKMGKDWGADEGIEDNILIELEKNGAGSRMYISFRSSEASHVTEAYTGKLFAEVKQVAEGKVR
ncbi:MULTISPECIES: hypothetical protein [Enterobacterales]|uniref:Uncharacterized protein n=1 Tax=Yersinia intermedia TaxID=631 RepID=A0A0T9M1M1_YERIN|nr:MULTISPECIES: hypothetical protein [Enterobacterales]MDM1791010.1 hypothetical protein [Serratia marcescens]MDM1793491.1 hypothetical protein [Serratia marcescens]MDM1798000.1 hypothetical protein [Serratia marcescens]MDM1803766.1 hypothetical protein [Serratia marcescens]MDM1809045.1 hypothetical protein [Serratia marcescens]